jgi:hypothetical protein
MILVTDAGGSASSAFCSNKTLPVLASIKTALLQLSSRLFSGAFSSSADAGNITHEKQSIVASIKVMIRL